MNERLNPLRHVLDTVQRWIDGEEPVWCYDKVISTWGWGFMMYRRRWMHPEYSMPSDSVEFLLNGVRMYELRDEYIHRFGFAIPCAELLDELKKAEHVVEVGAGSGYMTRLIRLRGIPVTGSDAGLGHHGFEAGKYDPMLQVRAEAKTMVRSFPESTVFCSWPTLDATWFRQMLKAMRIGQRLVTILEEACAEDSAREYLDACFEQEREIDIPCFEHMHDYASVHVKKRQRP